MNRDANTWQFPVTCPHCAAAAGTPARISQSTATTITIVVGCDRCNREWHLSANQPQVFLQRKPDRRVAKS